MKRVAVMVILFAVLLCGCKPYAAYSAVDGGDEINQTHFVSYHYLHFNSFEEYQRHFVFPPKGFIPWRILKRFGEFYSWSDVAPEYRHDGKLAYTDYLYSFTNDELSKVSLYVHLKSWDKDDFINRQGKPSTWEPDVDEPDNLWTAVNPRYHRYDLNDNVYYVYREGRLEKIYWQCAIYNFELWLDQYQYGANAFIDLLLDVDTAEAALGDFNADVEWIVRR